ncbi:bifunctional 4-hydroxy-2-oxoglutarate aldolase/2-dehydro-3-deoxy-phosphogluconate aldolase [Anoxybacterium hadale]|uniref:Bifunctional 4-hydroxy-2-oxoglutarate aldolase/2-dehydro-3-deoxy-phosphogluconate aldolase n=1 Tax=Anoxybacterium hadale TaxID=3408580 RepID=A0ACD1AG06_9FIRM|nr:bifunctional 4-hydroxy-2-oxoglutarate aldolase/2-dehydro-3-deoxy-phosphogluconate aldolase [Clostridiales bacterium]
MNFDHILKEVELMKIVPVVKLDKASDALPLAEALCAGGLPVAEITFRTDAAEESIRRITREFPDMLIGAGTVINHEQAERAIDAGARFIVSPGFSSKVTDYTLRENRLIFPGICTPTELMMALEYNLPVMKFFPAKQYGGLDTIHALAAPFPSVRFMPTGGINQNNILTFLASRKIIACGGSWMVNEALINSGDFQEITRLTAEAVALVQG